MTLLSSTIICLGLGLTFITRETSTTGSFKLENKDLSRKNVNVPTNTKRETVFGDIFYDTYPDDDYSLLNYIHFDPSRYRHSFKRPYNTISSIKCHRKSKVVSLHKNVDKNYFPTWTSISPVTHYESHNRKDGHNSVGYSVAKKYFFNGTSKNYDKNYMKYALILSKLNSLNNAKHQLPVGYFDSSGPVPNFEGFTKSQLSNLLRRKYTQKNVEIPSFPSWQHGNITTPRQYWRQYETNRIKDQQFKQQTVGYEIPVIKTIANYFDEAGNETDESRLHEKQEKADVMFQSFFPLFEPSRIQRKKVANDFVSERLSAPPSSTFLTLATPMFRNQMKASKKPLNLFERKSNYPRATTATTTTITTSKTSTPMDNYFQTSFGVKLIPLMKTEMPFETTEATPQCPSSQRSQILKYDSNIYSALDSLVHLLNISRTHSPLLKQDIARTTEYSTQSVITYKTEATIRPTVKSSKPEPTVKCVDSGLHKLKINFNSFDNLEDFGSLGSAKELSSSTQTVEADDGLDSDGLSVNAVKPLEIGREELPRDGLKQSLAGQRITSREADFNENEDPMVSNPLNQFTRKGMLRRRLGKGSYLASDPENSFFTRTSKDDVVVRSHRSQYLQRGTKFNERKLQYKFRQRRQNALGPATQTTGNTIQGSESIDVSLKCTSAAEVRNICLMENTSRSTPCNPDRKKSQKILAISSTTCEPLQVHTKPAIPFNLSVGSISCPQCHQEFTYRLGLTNVSI